MSKKLDEPISVYFIVNDKIYHGQIVKTDEFYNPAKLENTLYGFIHYFDENNELQHISLELNKCYESYEGAEEELCQAQKTKI